MIIWVYVSVLITFSNVTAVSENLGWTADIQTPEDGQYIHQAMAGQLGKQEMAGQSL